ncbi:MAG: hypothetical protein JXA99_03715 [Candidatus Lokiarchaeota archaeon]|nr:hypothetical protein [Candidatus Lokiarchaeota archaeon]
MKTSNVLNIETNLFIKDNIIIHPNEGYDLGLLNHSTPVKIFANTTIDIFNLAEEYYTEGTVLLENNCKQGSIQLSKKYWNSIGKPEKVRLFYEGNKVLISNM